MFDSDGQSPNSVHSLSNIKVNLESPILHDLQHFHTSNSNEIFRSKAFHLMCVCKSHILALHHHSYLSFSPQTTCSALEMILHINFTIFRCVSISSTYPGQKVGQWSLRPSVSDTYASSKLASLFDQNKQVSTQMQNFGIQSKISHEGIFPHRRRQRRPQQI